MLIGRERERGQLDALLTEARLGRGRALVLRGSAGIGKTVLLDYAVQQASGFQVLHYTAVDANGLAGQVQPGEGEEALLVSRLALADDGSFDQSGTIEFAPGHVLVFRSIGAAWLGRSPDPQLRFGAAVWEIEGGEGQFRGAHGRITSNFFVSDTDELTDNHFGLIFVARGAATHAPDTNPRSASPSRYPRDLDPVPSLERVWTSCGMRPLDGSIDQSPALPEPRLRGGIRPLRGALDRPPPYHDDSGSAQALPSATSSLATRFHGARSRHQPNEAPTDNPDRPVGPRTPDTKEE